MATQVLARLSGYSRGIALLAAFAAMVLAGGAQGQGAGLAADHDDLGRAYVPGELIVTYKSEDAMVEEPGLEAQLSSLEIDAASVAVVEGDIAEVGFQELSFPQIKAQGSGSQRHAALKTVKETLSSVPGVESVSYNFYLEYTDVPNDRLFGRQYGLRKINAPEAWNITRGRGAKIGIVDSGIFRHEDLVGKVAAEHDFANNDKRAEDRIGHGTAVAGVAAAVTGNRRGIAGTCPNCRLLVAKNGNRRVEVGASVKSIYWAAKRGADVINLSFGGPMNLPALKKAVNVATRKGSLVVAASGNSARTSNPRIYPAAYKNVLAVGATNHQDRRAKFSNYGSYLDVMAPGVGITTTVPGGYRKLDGTSFSAPHASGVAGLLASQDRSRATIRKHLIFTARDLGKNGRDPRTGHGLINAAAALRRG